MPNSIQKGKLSTFRPQENNANKHTERGLGMLSRAYSEVGYVAPMTAAADGEIIDGSARLETAVDQFGDEAIVIHHDGQRPIIMVRDDIPSADTPEAKAISYGANRIAQVDLDFDPAVIFADMQAGVPVADFWTDAELAELLAAVQPTGGGGDTEAASIDRAAELQAEWSTAVGQIWALGDDHRLAIGDCTDPATVEAVMRGERAKLLMTSPPYWVGKEYEQEHTWEQVQDFIEKCAAIFSKACSHRIVINTGAPPAAPLTGERAHVRLLLDDWQRELARYGFLMRYVRIWAKRGGLAHTAPMSDCIDQHWEFIGVFYDPKTYEGQRRLGEPWATDGLWDDIPGMMSAHGHVAAFPLEIPNRNVMLYTDTGDVILEPFCGSGTTLISCENLKRRCYAVELDPGYAATTLQRFKDHASQEPRLL